jgi:hypothetical protein
LHRSDDRLRPPSMWPSATRAAGQYRAFGRQRSATAMRTRSRRRHRPRQGRRDPLRGPWHSLDAVEFNTLERGGRVRQLPPCRAGRKHPARRDRGALYADLEATDIVAWHPDQTASGKPGAVQAQEQAPCSERSGALRGGS